MGAPHSPSPYYQSTDFTCGPACLVTALAMLGKKVGRLDELQIWREANTVYMGDGLPGTSAYGLALAAQKRGLDTLVYDFDHANLFAHAQGHLPDDQQDVLLKTLKHDEAVYRMGHGGVFYRKASLEVWKQHMDAGEVAIVLALDTQDNELHWILATAMDDTHVTVHDPYPYEGGTRGLRRVRLADFWRWIHHPPHAYQTALFLRHHAKARGPHPLPYMLQTTDFTCGPACLMVVLQKLRPELKLLPVTEYLLWRKANTVYLLNGYPGCGPYGLALVAQEYGLPVAVWAHRFDALLAQWNIRSENHPERINSMLGHDENLVKQSHISMRKSSFSMTDLRRAIDNGKMVMLLDVSLPEGHWIVLTGYGRGRWQVHDPLLDPDVPGDKPVKTLPDAEIHQRMRDAVTGGQVALVLG